MLLLVVCALFALYPQPYRAAMTLTPLDPSSLGLGSTLGQLNPLSSVLGNQSTVEISMRVANSPYVRADVSRRLDLPRRLGKSELEVQRWLEDKVAIRTLRGGILLFEIKLRDGELGRRIVDTYGGAVRDVVTKAGRRQTEEKRGVVLRLLEQASDRLSRAQAAYDSFRLTTRYSSPDSELLGIGARIPLLEQQIKAKQIQLAAQRRFYSDEYMTVQQTLAELAALQGQLAAARSTSPAGSGSVGRIVRESTEADRLRRELYIAQTLYAGYQRNLASTLTEDASAPVNIRVLEPAYVDPARQYNSMPIAIAALIFLLAIAMEFYALRPPVDDRVLDH